MSGVQAYLVDGVHIRIQPSQAQPLTNEPTAGWPVAGPPEAGYLALAKREPFVLPGVQPMHEPGDVWFKFGTAPADLIDHLVNEVNEARKDQA